MFNTAASTPFYDITTQLSALLGYTLKDQDLVTDIQYHLMEPATGNLWTGTDQFTLSDVTNAIQRRRDQFLSETGAVLTHSTINAPAPPASRVPLSDSIIDVRRAAWKDAAGEVSTLFRTDELQLDYGLSGWETNAATPSFYSTIVVPPLTLQLAPVSAGVGQVDMLTVNAGATLDPTVGVLLGIPDDFAWVVKWGALADLLGMDGQARDPDRAAYCEQRYREGIELARINPTVTIAQIQGVDNIVDDLWALDSALPNWQSLSTAAQPTVVATAGRNIVALANMPDGVYSVTLDVVRNSQVPAIDASFIQVGREILDTILDYAEHLAAFKMQGAEWKATNRCLENMMRQASIYNEKLKASALFKDILWPTAQRYKVDVPARETANA